MTGLHAQTIDESRPIPAGTLLHLAAVAAAKSVTGFLAPDEEPPIPVKLKIFLINYYELNNNKWDDHGKELFTIVYQRFKPRRKNSNAGNLVVPSLQ